MQEYCNSHPLKRLPCSEQGHRGTICSPSVTVTTHCSPAAGTSRALPSSCFSQGGSSSAFDFGLHLWCPTSGRWPCAPACPVPADPAAVRDAPRRSQGRAGPPRLTARLENKSRASRVHFRLFYGSHHPARPCRAEPALGRASPLWGKAGPAGHGPRSSPEQPWKSKAERARHKAGGAPRSLHVHSRCPSGKQSCGEPAHSSPPLVPSQHR